MISSDCKSDTTATDEESVGKKLYCECENDAVSDTSLKSSVTETSSRTDTEKTGSEDTSTSDKSVRLSLDDCQVKVVRDFKKITVVDKPTRLRSETRGQFMCRLALQFT